MCMKYYMKQKHKTNLPFLLVQCNTVNDSCLVLPSNKITTLYLNNKYNFIV